MTCLCLNAAVPATGVGRRAGHSITACSAIRQSFGGQHQAANQRVSDALSTIFPGTECLPLGAVLCPQIANDGNGCVLTWRFEVADRSNAVKWLSTQLSHQERQLLVVQAELESCPVLSWWEDPPVDADAVLDPVLLAIRHAASAAGAEPVPRSRSGAIEGLLSVMWSDLIDLGSDKLRSRWSMHDLPPSWAEEQARLIAAVESARNRLRGQQP